MGRDAGHIALNVGIGAGAEEILIPEENLGLDRLLESLKRSKKSGKSSSIVVVAEGDKIGKNVFELAEHVEQNMPDYEVRVSVLGHIQEPLSLLREHTEHLRLMFLMGPDPSMHQVVVVELLVH